MIPSLPRPRFGRAPRKSLRARQSEPPPRLVHGARALYARRGGRLPMSERCKKHSHEDDGVEAFTAR
eukprot:5295403-Pleurochrysis_carterae.AAC.2